MWLFLNKYFGAQQEFGTIAKEGNIWYNVSVSLSLRGVIEQWVMENKDTIPKEERYPLVRRWYAKDKGESMLREMLGLL